MHNPGQLPGNPVQNPKEYASAHSIDVSTYVNGVATPTSAARLCALQGREPSNGRNPNTIPDSESSTTSMHFQHSIRPCDMKILKKEVEKRAMKLEQFVREEGWANIEMPVILSDSQPDPMEEYRASVENKIDEIQALIPLREAIRLLLDLYQRTKELLLSRMWNNLESMNSDDKKIIQDTLDDPGAFTLPCWIN